MPDSNASDGFHSPADAADAARFVSLPALREVVFAGKTSRSPRRAYRMRGRGEEPIEMAHDDAPWEQSW